MLRRVVVRRAPPRNSYPPRAASAGPPSSTDESAGTPPSALDASEGDASSGGEGVAASATLLASVLSNGEYSLPLSVPPEVLKSPASADCRSPSSSFENASGGRGCGFTTHATPIANELRRTKRAARLIGRLRLRHPLGRRCRYRRRCPPPLPHPPQRLMALPHCCCCRRRHRPPFRRRFPLFRHPEAEVAGSLRLPRSMRSPPSRRGAQREVSSGER